MKRQLNTSGRKIDDSFYHLTEAVAEAASRERTTEARAYVMRRHDNRFIVLSTMPLIGEWYTSDGVRHG